MSSARWVGAGLVAVLTSVLLGGPGPTSQAVGLIALAAVAVALAALVAWTPLGAVYAGPGATCGPPERGVAPRLTSRVGDPVHHPVRPRAPGRV